jgi:hypothetical protein
MLDYLVRTEYQGMSRCSMNVRRLSSQGNERWLRVTLPINQANIFLASRSSLLESGGEVPVVSGTFRAAGRGEDGAQRVRLGAVAPRRETSINPLDQPRNQKFFRRATNEIAAHDFPPATSRQGGTSPAGTRKRPDFARPQPEPPPAIQNAPANGIFARNRLEGIAEMENGREGPF